LKVNAIFPKLLGVTWCIKCSEMIIIVYSFTWQDG